MRMPTSKGNPYQRLQPRVEYQLFTEDYFTGADMHIYFGDIFVDEVISLAFTLSEEVAMIYGYQSYTFDAVARGRRWVEGQFAINFKSTGYLKAILDNAMAVEHAVQKAKNKYPKEEMTLDDILKLYGKNAFDQIAQEYEDALWGKTENKNLLNSPTQTYFPSDQYGFDLRINYGPSEAHSVRPNVHYHAKVVEQVQHQPNRTVEVINGVQLKTFHKEVSIQQDGQPITEYYTFLARDINAPFYGA